VFDGVELPSGGMYTSVGTYSHTELLSIVGRLSELTGVSVHDLVMAYGKYLFWPVKGTLSGHVRWRELSAGVHCVG